MGFKGSRVRISPARPVESDTSLPLRPHPRASHSFRGRQPWLARAGRRRAQPSKGMPVMRSAFAAILWLVSLALPATGASASSFPIFSTWAQPGGPGAPITLTYSFSNLLDGSLRDPATGAALTADELRGAFEAALGDYAAILPIHFVETA